ncbi:MAG: flagellar basal body P-ring protein FlgI [Synergistaceae bacterium]|jgi:flagellar P-ring protein precursor FlgI|nr:flagellar basal body P-ring protein FlgI [Synergistaceae bacterium]
MNMNGGGFIMKGIFTKKAIFALAAISVCLCVPALAAPVQPMVRVKDIATVEGVRENQLVGMGLVVGLQGTGDKGPMAMQMMSNMTQQFGVTMDPKQIKSKNAAVVTVTCQLPPFLSPGQNADVLVSAMGDAKSLEGGVLLQTPLKAANGKVYAVAQGPLTIGGWSQSGAASTAKKNVVTVGRVPSGAIIEQGVNMGYTDNGVVNLLMRNSDFTTAQRVASAINQKFGTIAYAPDAGRVSVKLPASYSNSPAAFIASIEGMTVRPDSVAKVVVNERTGTVVMGGNVRIGNVSVAHGNLTVKVSENPQVSQPNAFSGGRTAVTPRTDIAVDEEQGPQLVELPTTSTVADLTNAMNAVGAAPRDLLAILQAMDEAGALHGTLVIQ